MAGDALIDGLRRVLSLREQQHHLIAGNLANADTPGFRAKSLDFDGLLGRAMNGGSLSGGTASDLQARVLEEAPAPWATDGNSVLVERETARMQANVVQFQAVSSGLSRRLALLRFAAGDGK